MSKQNSLRLVFAVCAAVTIAGLVLVSCASTGAAFKRSADNRSIIHGYIEFDGSTRNLDSVSLIGLTQEGKSIEKTTPIKKGGYFFFTDLEPGIYKISGMKSTSTTVTLSSRANLEKDHLTVDAAKVVYQGKIVMNAKQDGTHSLGLSLKVVADPVESVALENLKTLLADSPWVPLIDETAANL